MMRRALVFTKPPTTGTKPAETGQRPKMKGPSRRKRPVPTRPFPALTRTEESPLLAGRGLIARAVTVYLPPDYDPKRRRLYPLLVALDGQTMPQWRLAETLNELVNSDAIDPVVVVAVPATADRLDEYGVAGTLDFAGRGCRAKFFQSWLIRRVLPWVRKNYRVDSRASRTGIFGASMGGLAAFDLAWAHARVFGCAGIFSGSLWWRADNSDVAAQQASRIAHRKVRERRGRRTGRFWFEAGTRDETADRDGNGVIDAIQDTQELIAELEKKKFHPRVDVIYRQIEGGEHHESTWAAALPDFLRWALPPRRR